MKWSDWDGDRVEKTEGKMISRRIMSDETRISQMGQQGKRFGSARQ